ncbi:MAG: RIP metalloprotease RseP [Bacteroidaceae bacterium]|nr:RIP metalloprotease RseP [Bacteroidaceae bacterium]
MNISLIQWLQLFACLSLLVVLHEAGHFGFAKLFKTRVLRFYMFANWGFHLFSTYDNWFRRLLGKPFVTKRGDEGKNFFAWLINLFYRLTGQADKVKTKNIGNKEYNPEVGTEYGIGWLPIGGYVAIDGMIDETHQKFSGEPQPWEFRSKKVWQRFLIMFGGVLMNFLTAWFIYSAIMFTWGRDYIPMRNITQGFQYSQMAKNVGFQDGDIPVAVDGKEIAEYSTEVFRTLSNASVVTVLREGKEMELQMPSEGLNLLEMLQSVPPFLVPIAPAVIDSVLPGSAAQKAGFQKGTRLLTVNGKEIYSWSDFDYEITLRRRDVLAAPGCTHADSLAQRRMLVVYQLTDEALPDTVQLNLDEQYMMGVIRQVPDYKQEHTSYTLLSCIPAGLEEGWRTLTGYVNDLKYVPTVEGAKSVGSFFSIAGIFPDTWDWLKFWMRTALISIILAVMNILPIPGLDGGHIVILFYEAVTGRQPSEKVLIWLQYIGMGCLMLLMLLAFYNDISKFVLPMFGF